MKAGRENLSWRNYCRRELLRFRIFVLPAEFCLTSQFSRIWLEKPLQRGQKRVRIFLLLHEAPLLTYNFRLLLSLFTLEMSLHDAMQSGDNHTANISSEVE